MNEYLYYLSYELVFYNSPYVVVIKIVLIV